MLNEKHAVIENTISKNRKLPFCVMKLFLRDVIPDDIHNFIEKANRKAKNSLYLEKQNLFENFQDTAEIEPKEMLSLKMSLDRNVHVECISMSSTFLWALLESLENVYPRKGLLIYFKDRGFQDRKITDFLNRESSFGKSFMPLNHFDTID